MSSTTAKSFIDTNVLVYAGDNDTPAKQHVARTLIAEHSGRAVRSCGRYRFGTPSFSPLPRMQRRRINHCSCPGV
ncbi:MAG: hypothetical protein WD492_04020, partial [Alkalispirochaeta sp.]